MKITERYADWNSQVSDESEWRDVVGYEGWYQISSEGGVRSVERTITRRTDGAQCRLRGKLLTSTVNHRGRWCVSLYQGGCEKRKVFSVHTLVLEAFVGPRPPGMEGCHRNDIKSDNGVTNLYWGTRSENVADCVRNGLHNHARKTHCKRNHAFTPENTRLTTKGSRQCLACLRITRKAARNRG